MNEMLSRFVNEALSCLIIVPTTVLCLLPMKDKMKYSIKNVLPLFLGVLVMVTVIVSGATALLPVDPKVVFYILLVPLFLAYRVIVDADIVKCFATFLLSFAIMSFCKNYAIMIDAVIHPELGVPTFSTDGALIQLGISCAVTAAMEHGTGLHHFARKFPNRYYDVGIAEQHAVTFSAGLASMGELPVFAVYSSFLQRAYDQLMHDVAIGGLHVVLGIDRAGVVGEDGETHHGLYDVSFLSTVPGAVIYAPACYDELRLCLRRALYRDKGLACVRYPRGNDKSVFDKSALNTEYTHVSGKKTDILYISYGRVYDNLYRAAKRCAEQEVHCGLLKLTRIFPLADGVVDIAMSYRHVVFLEEAYYYGGISQLFGDLLLERGFQGTYRRVAPKQYLLQASTDSQMETMGLSEYAIYRDIRQEAEHGET